MAAALWRLAGPFRLHCRQLQLDSHILVPTIRSVRHLHRNASRHNSHDDADPSRFGDFIPVLSENPHAVGVSHITRVTSVPSHIMRPPYANNDGLTGYPDKPNGQSIITLGSPEEALMRNAARLARRTLTYARSLVMVGVTTEQIDNAIYEFVISHGAYPSPLGYRGFPKSCCTSVNNVMVHGIPDSRPLEDGDIVNIDVTVYLDGFHGDCSETFPVGNVDTQGLDLIAASHQALNAGIQACGPGRPFKGIGLAISSLMKRMGYSVNSEAAGHGIGKVFHSAPWILHHNDCASIDQWVHLIENDEPGIMVPGHCFTVEPAIVQGDDARWWMLPDGWTTLTETWARAAQMEHTILITESGVEILTVDD